MTTYLPELIEKYGPTAELADLAPGFVCGECAAQMASVEPMMTGAPVMRIDAGVGAWHLGKPNGLGLVPTKMGAQPVEPGAKDDHEDHRSTATMTFGSGRFWDC